MNELIEHGFGPYFDADSRILILGSFPSVKSRADSFYYAHPQNRFWRVIAACFDEEAPVGTDGKKALLSRHGIALWDVIERCRVEGSSDATIKDAVPADIARLCAEAPIKRVFLNGRTAEKYFRRFCGDLPLPVRMLPSTSPANASWTFERLCGAWGSALSETADE